MVTKTHRRPSSDVMLTVFSTSEHVRRMLRKSFRLLFPTHVLDAYARSVNLERALSRSAKHGRPEHFFGSMGVIADGRDLVEDGTVTPLCWRIAAACLADPELPIPLVVVLPDTGRVPEEDRDALQSFCGLDPGRSFLHLPEWVGSTGAYDDLVKRIVQDALMPAWVGDVCAPRSKSKPKKRAAKGRRRSFVVHCMVPKKARKRKTKKSTK